MCRSKSREGESIALIGRNALANHSSKNPFSLNPPHHWLGGDSGRVGSLLAVGTGFHPGADRPRKHVFSPALLGMGNREIERSSMKSWPSPSFRKFLTAVKYYLRHSAWPSLSAAHLEPEISLLVDEVFGRRRHKCPEEILGQMGDSPAQDSSRPRLSSTQSILSLPHRGFWLSGPASYGGNDS